MTVQPRIVTEVVLTLRCGQRGGACGRAVGWVGTNDLGELAVELLNRRVEHHWEGVVDKRRVRSWEVQPAMWFMSDLRRDPTQALQADCDRHGVCQFSVDAIDAALEASRPVLTSG